MTRLTDQAHDIISSVLETGEIAIDATAGNGHDTLFLCQTVGSTGYVYALDIQQQAINQTADHLLQAGFSNYKLMCQDHSHLAEIIPMNHQKHIGAIMFNLGYLPGGDHSKITQQDSTLQAIQTASELLRPGGILTILAYPGHPGGDLETFTVSEWIDQLDPLKFQSEIYFGSSESPSAPRLFVLYKRER